MPRKSLPRTAAPEAIDGSDWAALVMWTERKYPWLLKDLDRLADACLDHHRAKGNLFSDWPAAVRNWIRNEDRYKPEIGRGYRKRQRERYEAQRQERERRSFKRIKVGAPHHRPPPKPRPKAQGSGPLATALREGVARISAAARR